MSRESKLTAIVVKKQPYGEGDEIITFYTKERGKLRGLAKSSRFSKSKLQYSLQTLFLVNLTLSGSGLPKVIGAESVTTFPNIRQSLEAAQVAFYGLELLLKFTPDEQKNEALFELYLELFAFINAHALESKLLNLALAKFRIELLERMGLAVQVPPTPSAGELYFSSSKGGFLLTAEGVDHMPVSPVTYRQFLELKETGFGQLPEKLDLPLFSGHNTVELHEVLAGFVRYQLERDIKSERYLDVV